MSVQIRLRPGCLMLVMVPLLAGATAPGDAGPPRCRQIHADLVEVPSTEGCNPGLASCFLGEVAGNHGLEGTTHFNADSAAAGPATSPGFISYGGAFEYRTARGTLYMRETGVTSPAVVTAYQQVDHGDGRFEGATGYFFVSGNKSPEGVVTTGLSGQLCLALGRP